MKIKLFFLLCVFFSISIFSCGSTEEGNPDADDQMKEPVDKGKLLQLVNDVRTAGCTCGNKTMPPVPAIAWNEQLEKAAVSHSIHMNKHSHFSHTGKDGSTPGDRITKQNYAWVTYGENIAQGQQSEEQVMQSWLNSPGHCENIMNANFKDMAVGRSGDYWTQLFASK